MQGALVIVGDDVLHQSAELDRMPGGVEAGAADELTDLALHHVHGIGHATLPVFGPIAACSC